ncbi:MAG: leucine-rich repeat domain-containing protein [Bacteroidaceae bacterium]|nr:leucine-rich repeat domain-containing protein [Bacteroidaceae bacterium]
MKKITILFSALIWLMSVQVMAEVGDVFTDETSHLKFKVIRETEEQKEVQVIRADASLSGEIVIPDHVTNNDIEYSVASIKGGEQGDGCAFREMNDITSITIPYTVYSIEYSAFYHCEGLTAVYNNGNMDMIDGWTFNGCTNLEYCTIPSTIKIIGESAFEGCTKLDNVVFPEGLEKFNTHAFKNCTSLKRIVLHNNISDLSTWTFEGCSSLKYVSLPTSISLIGEGVFFNCSSLEEITIPANITEFYDNVFNGCSSLMSIYYLADNISFFESTNNQFTGTPGELRMYTKQSPKEGIASVVWGGRFGENRKPYVEYDIPYTQAKEYMTFCRDFDVDFSSTDGLMAGVALSSNLVDNKLTLTVRSSVPAGTGVLLKGDVGTYSLRIAESSPEAIENNLLKGVVYSMVIPHGDGKTAFVLQDGIFKVANENHVLQAGKAYLELPSENAVHSLSFSFDDITTGIGGMAAESASLTYGNIYNLNGQRVSRITKGMYIINGKKTIVK